MPSKRTVQAGRFYATVEAAQAEGQLLAFRRSVDTETNKTIRVLANIAVNIFRFHAPERSGRLKRNIKVSTAQGRGVSGRFGSGLALAITTEAKNPETGFDYVAATRFGHNVKVIRPKTAPKLATFTARDGRRVSTASVTPRIVTRDWAEAAADEMDREAASAAISLSRRLGRRSL